MREEKAKIAAAGLLTDGLATPYVSQKRGVTNGGRTETRKVLKKQRVEKEGSDGDDDSERDDRKAVEDEDK